ncbi:MAG: DUF4388 domain-containing protein [Ktedonobacteraceae bacterium]|nr:DUF4388 domain-containing protein [Ktedonobacteraceae bacterium]
MEQQDRIMDGDLQTLGLQSILKMLALSGKTGKLYVYSGPETLSVGLRKGQIVGLHEEGVPQPDLLAMLCLINRLDPARVQTIRELAQGDMQVTLATLVERGWMTVSEMQRRLEFAVTQCISHALRWVNGRFEFHRQLVPMDSKMLPLDIDSVLLEALRQADEWEEIAKEGVMHLTRTTVARWQPEVSRDVRSMELNAESIEVLCLSNGELPLQAISLALMMPEARVAHIMTRLVALNLIEVVDTAFEDVLRQDLADRIMRSQNALAWRKRASDPVQHLHGLLIILAECINELLVHHGKHARVFLGRGQISSIEIVRYLERRFAPPLQPLSSQYPILETANFSHGQLNCNEILALDKVVKGQQLEEFYWEAVQGLSAFLRMLFAELLHDEVGSSSTGRQLSAAWKLFLFEFEQEVQQYQTYRAQRAARAARDRNATQPSPTGVAQNRSTVPEVDGRSFWSSEKRRSI